MLSKNTVEKVLKSEVSFTKLFSKVYEEQNGPCPFIRFYDDALKDMYDHNFSLIVSKIDDNALNYLMSIKEKRSESFIKISAVEHQEFLVQKGFEEEITLTLAKEDYQNFKVPSIDFVEYKRYTENNDIISDVIKLEKEYYGKEYGEDFCERRWLRYKKRIDEDNKCGLDIWVVYAGTIPIAYSYSFSMHGVVSMDGLLVVKEYRNKYVASNLIKAIAAYYQCPIYLHAEESETPKELYYKLGFEKCSISYDYLLLDKKQ